MYKVPANAQNSTPKIINSCKWNHMLSGNVISATFKNQYYLSSGYQLMSNTNQGAQIGPVCRVTKYVAMNFLPALQTVWAQCRWIGQPSKDRARGCAPSHLLGLGPVRPQDLLLHPWRLLHSPGAHCSKLHVQLLTSGWATWRRVRRRINETKPTKNMT